MKYIYIFFLISYFCLFFITSIFEKIYYLLILYLHTQGMNATPSIKSHSNPY